MSVEPIDGRTQISKITFSDLLRQGDRNTARVMVHGDEGIARRDNE